MSVVQDSGDWRSKVSGDLDEQKTSHLIMTEVR